MRYLFGFFFRKNFSRNITFLYESNETGPSSLKAGDRRCYWRGGVGGGCAAVL